MLSRASGLETILQNESNICMNDQMKVLDKFYDFGVDCKSKRASMVKYNLT